MDGYVESLGYGNACLRIERWWIENGKWTVLDEFSQVWGTGYIYQIRQRVSTRRGQTARAVWRIDNCEGHRIREVRSPQQNFP
jgi:hypothetical protein